MNKHNSLTPTRCQF